MKRLEGVLGPVTTPFDASTGGVAVADFRANVESHLRAGLHGIVVAGSTGEAPLLDDDERRALVESVRELVGHEQWLIAGVGSESTKQTVRRAREAAAAGADAVLVVSPHYYAAAMSAGALRAHFMRVADESPVPLVLYNIPKYAHFSVPPDLVGELAAHGNVIGLKDSSGDPGLIAKYLTHQSARFTVLTGNGATLAQALASGVRGGILGASLFAPALSLAVYDLHVKRDRAGALLLQERLTPLAKTIVGELGVAGVKGAMDLVGLVGGAPRSPLLPLDAAGRALVSRLLESAGVPTEGVILPA